MKRLDRALVTTLALVIGLSSCGGAGSPSVSIVQPASVFLGRTLDLIVSGSATAWSDKTTVSFGDGVTVNKVSAASATALLCNVTVTPAAKLGARDVTVTDGGQSQTYKGAFTVESPIEVGLFGTAQQGSIATLRIRNLDLRHPFDTTSTGGGLFGPPPEFINIAIKTPPGTTLQVGNVGDYVIDATLLTDVDAAATVADLDVVSGPKDDVMHQIHFPMPGAIEVKERTAQDLPAGAPTSANIDKAYDSLLFKLTPGSGPRLVDLAAAGDDADAQPAIALLPKSGHFKDLVGFAATHSFVTTSTDAYYAIVWDSSGTANYAVELTHKEATVNQSAESEENNDKAKANALSALPALVKGASLTDKNDQDWFAIPATTGDVGKKIHVTTMAGASSNAQTDLVVDVLGPDGTTSLGGPSRDADYHEDFTSGAISAAGTYFVKVYASSTFSASSNGYDVVVRLE